MSHKKIYDNFYNDFYANDFDNWLNKLFVKIIPFLSIVILLETNNSLNN